jgi:hypothetical protein
MFNYLNLDRLNLFQVFYNNDEDYKKESEVLFYEVIKDEANNMKKLTIRDIENNNERTVRILHDSIKFTL